MSIVLNKVKKKYFYILDDLIVIVNVFVTSPTM